MRSLVAALFAISAVLPAQQQPQRESHVVFLVGEREYGSADTMPKFGERLQRELGLRVTVLQSRGDELPELDALDSADLLVLYLRFRTASDAQFERLRQWFDAGKPCLALRTTSHAFVADKGWFPPFFGGHYKAHAPNGQGTQSYVVPAAAAHPILRGLRPDVEMGHGGTYNAQPLAATATPLLLGRTGRLPAEPIAWINRYRPASRLFYTSLGSRENFEREDFQRLLGNAVLWCLDRDVPAGSAFGGGVPRAGHEPAEPPPPPPFDPLRHATVLFDGNDTSKWRHWDPSVEPLAIAIDRRADTSAGGETYDAARWRVENGALVARPGFGDIVTTAAFGNYNLHFDFFVPREPDSSPDAFRGHSGVYLGGRHEIQIAAGGGTDEFACGAIYGVKGPDRDVATEPGTWQSFDIQYRHLQDEDPFVSVWLNGVQIHDKVRLPERTLYGFRGEPAGARSVTKGDGLRHARDASESFAFADGRFTIAARFKTNKNGTIAAKAPPTGEWKPDSKALFLRGGRLVYDIGWVGQMQTPKKYNDGNWHRVLLTHDGGEALLFVDGEEVAARANFTAPDAPGHVFKIGTASPNFGGAYAGQISDVIVYEHPVPAQKAVQWTRGEVIDMGKRSLEWRPAKKAEAEPAANARVVVEAPIRLQADSSPVRFANVWLSPLLDTDHRRWISKRDAATLARGAELWQSLCHECHGKAAEAFPKGTKWSTDPLSMFVTLETGVGDKQAMAWLPPEPRYAVIHHLRDALGLAPADPAYLNHLAPGFDSVSQPRADDDSKWPPYRRMDYGNALHWTYQVAADNIAQKGIAVRLDPGPGGVSRGRAFMVYDHDTMRVAAAWTGEGFIDWKGVAFDASHNSHASITGNVAFVNPVGPGWADPATGSFDDQRLIGRDGRRFGPLPREWARYWGRQVLGERQAIAYMVGDALVREIPGFEDVYGLPVFTRALRIDRGSRDHWMRIAPANTAVALQIADDSTRTAALVEKDGYWLLHVPAGNGALRATLAMAQGDKRLLALWRARGPYPDGPVTAAAKPAAAVTVRIERGESHNGFAVDTIPVPDLAANPHHSWLRLSGLDFFADDTHAAVSTWNGDVWLISGIGPDMQEVTWRRIASGLHQPLGVRIVGNYVHVGCRDQIVTLDVEQRYGEATFYNCFNNDHQVTEHFHEFAMGLQTDADGNFYYAKSARHAKTALVPHHGTLLKVSKDGSTTEIVANGFRAANGVCINDDGSFYVTDQEGHWTPKNRINRVVPGGFYGNMMGYHDRTSTADADMQQPLCWLTNAFDRSPAELLRVSGGRWGLPDGSLLQLSYGMGRAFLVLEDEVGGHHQGGMVALPIEPFPTGIMRGRFHPTSGQLYCCGLYGWSGARTRPGGLYRVRYTGGELRMPTAMHVRDGGIELDFGCALDRELAEDVDSYGVVTWQLRRSKSYGSKHLDTRERKLASATLRDGDRRVWLAIPSLEPTMCIEIRCNLETPDEQPVRATIHGTIHAVR